MTMARRKPQAKSAFPWTVIDPRWPNKPAKLITTDEELRQSVTQDLYGRASLEKARAEWNAYRLMGFDPADRAIICQALIDAFARFSVKPPDHWQDMIARPDFYEAWKAEMNDGANGEPTDPTVKKKRKPSPRRR
jgi:hypothetical protein